MGATWPASVFPLYVFESVQPKAVQAALIQTFERWGMPCRLRVDNGQPWGGRDLPTVLSLWLLGLGIEVVWNRPRQPTDNSHVERAHRTNKNWVEASSCNSQSALQQRLEQAHQIQRNAYPYRQGQARTQVYPTLERGARRFDRRDWQLSRIDEWFQKRWWARRVDSSGKISLYGRNYSVGKRYRRDRVSVRFEPESRCWQVFDAKGDCLKSMPTRELHQQVIEQALLTGSMQTVKYVPSGQT